MFKTESLMVFTEVAKTGGFSKAALNRGQTPMAVSKQIAQLEKQLGEPLFERSTRKVRLTGFGEDFLQRAQQILLQHESLEHWLEERQGNIGGTLKVVSQSLQTYDETVMPYLAEFHRLYPQLELSFDVQERIIEINQDPYDIYWGVGDYLGMQHSGLKRRLMWRASYGIFASPEYLAKYGTPQTPDDLAGHRMIGYVHQVPGNVLVVNKTPNSAQKEIEAVELEVPIKVIGGQSRLAAQGLGLINAAHDNHDIKQLLASGELVKVLQDYWYSQAEVYIYYQQVKYEQAKVRAFIDFFLSKRDLW